VQIEIAWDEGGLVPVVVQDAATDEVLMLAYMNAEALSRTLVTGEAWFWSRSRQKLWHKGATSGHTQQVVELRYDCDADALLLRVNPRGPACHTGQNSCFYRRLPGSPQAALPTVGVLDLLWTVVQDRKLNPREGSYTCRLLEEGETRILKKVGEEAVEVLVAAQSEGDERLVSELADLVYHILVLLAVRNLSWVDVEAELGQRMG
jgi:phosphoribosyl-ATP pyrophosphohydrolase/phosphoribosyl-AMP cyclohydrolase